SRKGRSSGIGALSAGSNPTFLSASGTAAAAWPALLGAARARKANAARKSVVVPTIWRALFISLFLFLRRRRRGCGQTLFGDNLHRILDGNLRDAARLVDPFQLFIGFGVFLNLFAQVGLWIGLMAGNALQPRLRGQRSKIL